MAKTSHTVGIFTRDDIKNYNWLISLLHHTLFHSVVKNVLPKYVSNSFMDFEENVSECSFAILYHTLKRGRLNITDVTDSLYDEELEYLFQILGKENVIVVIDDLTDSSDAQMREIIRSQPSIERYACKLFLISEKEKKSCNIEGSEAKWSESATDDSLQEEHNSITDKRNQMKEILAGPSSQKKEQKSSLDTNTDERRHSDSVVVPTEEHQLMDPNKEKAPKRKMPCNLDSKGVLIFVIVLIVCLIIALITVIATSV